MGEAGFNAALLHHKISISKAELTTAFNLICNNNSELRYYDWICGEFPDFKQHFTSSMVAQGNAYDPIDTSHGLSRGDDFSAR